MTGIPNPEPTSPDRDSMVAPWANEPDNLEWRSNSGLDCVLVRNSRYGHFCGYVQVPEGHPLTTEGGKSESDPIFDDFTVHGGVTYFGRRFGKDGGLWVGFDAGHGFDDLPFYLDENPVNNDTRTYRNVSYMQAECDKLARQLVEMSK